MTNLEWLGVLAPLGGFAIAFATFWMRFGSRLSKAETDAQHANEAAKDAQEKISLQSASFSLYREQVAREYIHREVMREVEDRLTAAIERLGDRLDRFVEASRK